MGKEIIRSRGKERIEISEPTEKLVISNCRQTTIVIRKSAKVKTVEIRNSELQRLQIRMAVGTTPPEIKWRDSKAKFFDLHYP